jgi:hypothetical protein
MLLCRCFSGQNGIGGKKAAREFTRSERGRNKFKSCRRMVVWKCIQRLLDRRGTVGSAVRRIHSVYGEISVTDITNKMRRDETSEMEETHGLDDLSSSTQLGCPIVSQFVFPVGDHMK